MDTRVVAAVEGTIRGMLAGDAGTDGSSSGGCSQHGIAHAGGQTAGNIRHGGQHKVKTLVGTTIALGRAATQILAETLRVAAG